MYPNIDQVDGGRWWAWYFVVYYSFCTTLMANILTGLIIDAFDIAKVCCCLWGALARRRAHHPARADVNRTTARTSWLYPRREKLVHKARAGPARSEAQGLARYVCARGWLLAVSV